jgi:peptidyl-tRNA hydrolase, PTH1 family
MYAIVGLGNPGAKYQLTRHNVGFMVIEALEQKLGAKRSSKKEFDGFVSKAKVDDHDVMLLQPQTFMNLSGGSVQGLMTFYKIPLENLLVIHDEVDVPFGQVRFQKNRGHGGHNGIRDVHAKLGPDYSRLRVGVGRPTIPQMEVADYVLQNFSEDELKKLTNGWLDKLADAALVFIEDGFVKAPNKINNLSIT